MLEEIDNRPATLIGDILYWPMKSRYIISFNNMMRRLKYIECPYEMHNAFRRNLHIFKGHNGDVSLAIIRGFTLETWSSARSSTYAHSWMRQLNIELDTLLTLDTSFPYVGKYAIRLLCVFEDRDMLVVLAKEGAFQLDISNMQWKKYNSGKHLCTLYPYLVPPD
jgi:hypothetical protein